ncbi:putative valyl tRNA synthetase [Coccomyxa subellipsoidea C-169]|uniref:Valine--tRNA ligase, mitochondrial n=1 Tax=Coccomyxa subellipsoidea (strain C-169) TaxID=574566 RepID=I0YKK4_COCSC|nr:putative valyl tRNA synthetase [Coccomyxa subellipsoidea C-169]EIE18923.1 putative valyl tRNA synthetase [Coccomyxa subellipsoidea C-169]|eukprot:XP_005643467.1 putative valyl tRNA synthetase [Coccomyxa subellipsoidea C-169]
MIDAARATPKGQKKDYAAEMPKGYDPKFVEAATYAWWEDCGYFKPNDKSDAEPFVIVIPPPNVTGSLHLGHALMVAVEDTLTRWHRMSGRNALWVPGTDHAGIATQTVVEKQLQREQGITRHDLGREAFVGEVYKWVDTYGGKILAQLRRMGASPDWSRLAFTMDDKLSAAVLEAFLRLHKEGLIYRDNRLVNWCTRLKTAVSDIEVDYIDIAENTELAVPGYDEKVMFGVLTSFAYPLEDGAGEIVVATTRPETMLGDTAVAVHPDDPRYAHLHGKHVVHPLDGRKIPIITDAELVDISFGTGAVKITPAHDPNDFATGKRHALDFINILTNDGAINERGGQFAGQPRFQARKTVVDWLKEKGLYRGEAGNAMRLGLCSRSKDVIEPVLKPQWWVSCKGMADDACAAVRDGRISILPDEFKATWFRWLENIRDWCISRQLWFGHRIPAYYVTLEGEGDAAPPGTMDERMDRWVVARDAESARKVAEERFPGKVQNLVQDDDVLDTWFSSGLFPFSVFGWPEQTPDLAKYYPTTLLETGHDILFFWVARMVMMGMKLTGEVPFKQIYLHSMVRDAHGRKMSKSLGNVIDPLHVIEGISLEGLYSTLGGGNLEKNEMERAKQGQKADFPEGIEECGTDALRFTLLSYTSQALSVNLDIKRVVANRYWCNKLWNAVKFALERLGDDFRPSPQLPAAAQLPLPCRWILSRLNAATQKVVTGFETYSFADGTQALYGWWQYDLCDVFVELVKPVIPRPGAEAEAAGAETAAPAAFTSSPEGQQAYKDTLWLCLDTGLRLLHPFMPFVTEELWQRLPGRRDQSGGFASIMIAPFPAAQPSWADPTGEDEVALILDVVRAARSLRSDYDLKTKQRQALHIACKVASSADVLRRCSELIGTLALSDTVKVLQEGEEAPKGCGVYVVNDAMTVCLDLEGIVDPQKEAEKLQAKQAKLAEQIEVLNTKRSMSDYEEKTPEDIRRADAEKLKSLADEEAMLQQHLKSMLERAQQR